MAYGAPLIVDPYETHKIVGGVTAIILAGVGLFALIRSFGKLDSNRYLID